MILHLIPAHRVARQDGHAALTGKLTKTLRVLRSAQTTVAVSVQPSDNTCIRRQRKYVGIGDPGNGDGISERGKRDQTVIIVHVKQQQDIRRGMGDDLRHGQNLRVRATRDVTQQQTGSLPRKTGVIQSNIEALGLARSRACQKAEQTADSRRDQIGCKPSAAA